MPFNVQDYGAAGDGATNDTSAVQRAITAAATAGGGEVFFPEGVYPVAGASLTNNLRLTGPGKIIGVEDSSSASFVDPGTALENVVFTGLAFSRHEASTAYGCAIEIRSVGTALHTHIEIHACTFDGIQALYLDGFKDAIVSHCYVSNTMYEMYDDDPLAYFNQDVAAPLHSIELTDGAVNAFFFGTGENIVFTDNVLSRVLSAFACLSAEGVLFTDNLIHETGFSAVVIRYNRSGTVARSVVCADNVIKGAGKAAIGLELLGGDPTATAALVSISNNVIDGFGVYDGFTNESDDPKSSDWKTTSGHSAIQWNDHHQVATSGSIQISRNMIDGNQEEWPNRVTGANLIGRQMTGISARGPSKMMSIEFNKISNLQGRSISLDGADVGGTFAGEAIIQGNWVTNAGLDFPGDELAAIRGWPGAIVASATKRIVVEGNVVRWSESTQTGGDALDGILIRNAATCRCLSNEVTDELHRMDYGFNVTSGVGRLIAHENFSEGATVAPYLFSGPAVPGKHRNNIQAANDTSPLTVWTWR